MPLTRGELKALIKECLVEILSEGLGNVQAAASRPLPPGRMPIQGSVREGKANGRTNGNGRRVPDYDPRLDTPLAGGRKVTDTLKDQIKLNAGGNPIMESILADTAVTTLATLAGDKSLGSAAVAAAGGHTEARSGIPQVEQINGRPEEVFGEEAASRWSALAFMDPKKPA
jgi:hypothetical protein